MAVPVMGVQQIDSEIIFQVPPNRMDMIGIVLGVVVFRKETGAMESIVMGDTRFL